MPEMVAQRHAALRNLVQHIIWQQVFMKPQNTVTIAPMSKDRPSQHLDAAYRKK
jgi:hypothetical protein